LIHDILREDFLNDRKCRARRMQGLKAEAAEPVPPTDNSNVTEPDDTRVGILCVQSL